MLLGEQLLQLWAQPYFRAGANETCGVLQKWAQELSSGNPCCSCCANAFLPLHPFPCLADFVIVLLRGGFTPQNLWRVVIKIPSVGVKQDRSVSFSKTRALPHWPLRDKCLIQTNPRCFSERITLLLSGSTADAWIAGMRQPAVGFSLLCLGKVETCVSKAACCLVNVCFYSPDKVIFILFLSPKVNSEHNLKDSFQLSLVGNQKYPSSWIHVKSLLWAKTCCCE